MPNVIDELVVLLDLDPTKFKEGERDALDAFRRTRNEAESFGRDISQQGMKLSEVFSTLKAGVIGLAAGFIGNDAVQFIHNVANADAATGRWAKSMGISVDGLSKWQGMIRQVGGDARSATSTLSDLQQQIESVRQGTGMFEGGFAALMNKAGVSMRDNADASLLKIRKYLADEVGSGRMRQEEASTWLRRVPGMNQDMLNLLSATDAEFNKIAATVTKMGAASDKSAESGQKMLAAWDRLWQAIEQRARGMDAASVATELIEPVVKDVSTDWTKAFKEHKGLDRLRELGISGLWETLKEGFTWKSWSGGKPDSDVPGQDKSLWEKSRTPRSSTRGDRNNNPGNIEDGPFARSHGAIGSDGRFAIFPNKESGESAMADLLMKNYQGLNLAQIQRKWVGNSEDHYLRSMMSSTGLGPGEVPNLSDPELRRNLMRGMTRGEGTSLVGARAAAASRGGSAPAAGATTSVEMHIGEINVNAPKATDADGIAKEIGPAMKRSSITAPANYGLV